MRPLAALGGFGDRDWDVDADDLSHPDDEAPVTQRETIPVPRESGVRLQVSRVPGTAATVDVVVCDLTRDPRSEDFVPGRRRSR